MALQTHTSSGVSFWEEFAILVITRFDRLFGHPEKVPTFTITRERGLYRVCGHTLCITNGFYRGYGFTGEFAVNYTKLTLTKNIQQPSAGVRMRILVRNVILIW